MDNHPIGRVINTITGGLPVGAATSLIEGACNHVALVEAFRPK